MCDMPQGRQTVSDAEIIEFMETSDEPAFIAKEIASEFGINKETARKRLNQLSKEGKVYRKKPSLRTVLWWAESDNDYSARSA